MSHHALELSWDTLYVLQSSTHAQFFFSNELHSEIKIRINKIGKSLLKKSENYLKFSVNTFARQFLLKLSDKKYVP